MYETTIKRLFKRIRFKKTIYRETVAEFLGTFALVLIINGVGAQVNLSAAVGNPTSDPVSLAAIVSCICVSFCIFLSWGVDGNGGHINPAVSLAFCTNGLLPWWKLPFYLLAQYLGAFMGAGGAYCVYLDALNKVDPHRTTIASENRTVTANIFATYPQPYLTAFGGFVDQFVGTALLVVIIMAVTDPRNNSPAKSTFPIVVGQLIISLGFSYTLNCGCAINPARDLGPRIFTAVAGWGIEPFSFNDYNWWWVPIVGPHLGAIAGLWIYILFIGAHWQDEERNKIQ